MESRFFPGPVGRLDTRFHGPQGGPPALVLSPHPLLGGSMATALVHGLAEALAAEGWRAVRFDYRGVGRSAGGYGQGTGEAEDAAVVADALAAESGRRPVLVGYSFGGAVACRLAATRGAARLVLVATPLLLPKAKLRPAEDAGQVGAPAHLVVGDGDPFVPREDARRLAAAFRPAASLAVVPGAGHFLDRDHHAEAVAAVLAVLGRGA